MANEQNLILFKPGQSGNPNGRPKGRKNLSTIIRELEDEEFDFSKIPGVPKKLQKLLETVGAPFRAVVLIAFGKALNGDVKSMEWLRRAGYGDKLDLTSKGERIKQEPIIISTINARHADTETKTTEGT